MGSAVFRPDVIVQGVDRPQLRLAVEIRRNEVHMEEASRRLRHYMHEEACPLGLLVTPEWTRFYRETYSDAPDSIRELAVVETSRLLHVSRTIVDDSDLERTVLKWLKTMLRQSGSASHRKQPVSWVEEQLLPALVDAEVMVAGPR